MRDGWRPADYGAVEAMISELSGLTFPASRSEVVRAAIGRSVARAPTRDPTGYVEWLQGSPEARAELLDELTVGETYFFRDPAQFELIRREILGGGAGAGGDFRAWSAGCASGEEAYSLAILLHEQGRAGRVLGTDISEPRLARARAATYGRWSLRGVPEAVIRRHFRTAGGEVTLRPEIRSMVDFRTVNLAGPEAARIRGMDLVLCRNVLIYLEEAAIARVARTLLGAINPGGWVLLGASDPPIADLVDCEVVATEAGLAYRRRGADRSPLSGAGPGTEPGVRTPAVRPAVRPPPPRRSPPIPAGAQGRSGSGSGEREGGGDAAPTDSEVAARARSLADRGDLEAAGRACAAALDRNPMSAELTALHAMLLTQAGRPGDAARAARQAVYLDRSLAVAHVALGLGLAGSGDRDGARRAFGNAARLLSALPLDAVVPASGGERASTMTQLVRLQLRLLATAA